MNKQTVLALFCALAVSACTSMRLEGFVTDEKTGEPIGTCGITIGEKYIHVDTAGHYSVNARTYWKTMQLVAPGYFPKTVTVSPDGPRYRKLNLQMTPNKTAKATVPKGPGGEVAAKAPAAEEAAHETASNP